MVKSLSVSPDAGREPSPPDLDLDITPLKKQVSLYLLLPDWRLLRAAAARRRIPITALVQEWLAPHVAELRRGGTEAD